MAMSHFLKIFVIFFHFAYEFGITFGELRSSTFLIKDGHYQAETSIAIVEAKDDVGCRIHCHRDKKCSSFNFMKRKNQNDLHRCELFDSVKDENIIQSQWSDFYQKIFGWSTWGPWSYCPLPSTCNQRSRNRTCTSNAYACPGSTNELEQCPAVPYFNRAACESALGMEDGTITDSQISASSHYGPDIFHSPKNARLNKQIDSTSYGAWSAASKTINDYLQVDLGIVKVITKVAIQGRKPNGHHFQWVTKFSISYGNDGTTWAEYEKGCTKIFPGNVDMESIVFNDLEIPITARYIRMIVKGFNKHPSLRIELYGCDSL